MFAEDSAGYTEEVRTGGIEGVTQVGSTTVNVEREVIQATISPNVARIVAQVLAPPSYLARVMGLEALTSTSSHHGSWR
jgi:hypothetical protein